MTSHLFPSSVPIFIQGMTGREGLRMAEWMMSSGANVVAGVTPGKAGQEALGKPVFGSVGDALKVFPDVPISCIAVPAAHVKSAALEALKAGISCVYILSEQVPVHDVLAIRAVAAAQGATVIGPSSVGYLQFPQLRLGYLGGQSPFETLRPGGLALVSTSGGMANEILFALARRGVGIRVAMAVGGDRVPGTTVREAVQGVMRIPEVTDVAVFVEPGNPFLSDALSDRVALSKPVSIILPGDGLEALPRGLPYGHTGTILEEGDESLARVRARLREKGIACFDSLDAFYTHCQPQAQPV